MGNGVLVQQTMRESYARQSGQLPGSSRQGQHSQVGHPGTNARVTFGQQATDEEFEEVQVCKVTVAALFAVTLGGVKNRYTCLIITIVRTYTFTIL